MNAVAALPELLRLVHVVAVVVALSAAAMYGVYAFVARGHSEAVAPFVRARHDFPQILAAASMIALVVGYGLESSMSSAGLSFAIGGLAALMALAIGEIVLGPTAMKLGELGHEIGPNDPSPQQARQLRWLSTRLDRAERADLALLSVAVVCLLVSQLPLG